MNTRTTIATVAAITALLGGCASGAEPKPVSPPSPSPSSPASPTATLSLAAHKAWCTEELVARHAGRTGSLQSDPQPVGCLGLENNDFLNAYYDALMEVNRKGREALWSPRPTS
jgi:hypothetical protein